MIQIKSIKASLNQSVLTGCKPPVYLLCIALFIVLIFGKVSLDILLHADVDAFVYRKSSFGGVRYQVIYYLAR